MAVKNIDLNNLVPPLLRNEFTNSFNKNVFNRFLSKEETEVLLGYVGDLEKASPNDTFIHEESNYRAVNTLVPMAYSTLGSEEYLFDFEDLLKKLAIYDVDTKTFDYISRVQPFNFNVPIDLDKFINYSKYHWYGHLISTVITTPDPGLNIDDQGIFVQSTPSDTWVVTHNFGEDPIVRVFMNNEEMLPASITYDDDMMYITITFTSPMVGIARLYSDKLFEIDPITPPVYNTDMDPEYIVQKGSGTAWSDLNFWIHLDDVTELSFILGRAVSIAETVQARRPIFEYYEGLELNTAVRDGVPCSEDYNPVYETAPALYAQEKIKRNQYPLFNLYYNNGDHAGLVSPLVSMTTDQDSPFDEELGIRTKVDDKGDYQITNGLISDDEDFLYFYKIGADLKSPWVAGDWIFTSKHYAGKGSGTIGDFEKDSGIVYETWTVTAIDALTFTVVGSVSGAQVNATVDTSYSNGLISFEIKSGVIPFDTGDVFTFRTQTFVNSSYVTKDQKTGVTTELTDAEKLADIDNVATWTLPDQLFYNVTHECRKHINFADLQSHYYRVLRAQPNFEGTEYGQNNFRDLEPHSLGLGGRIKDHDTNFGVIFGLLNQSETNVPSMIDFATRMYRQQLNSLIDFFVKEAPDLLTERAINIPEFYNETPDSGIQKLYKVYIEEILTNFNTILLTDNSDDEALPQTQSIFADTTSNVPNWVITLPYLGLVNAHVPFYTIDPVTNGVVLIHHDGHSSPIGIDTQKDLVSITKRVYLRSDGTSTAGVDSITAPTNPYKNQFWFNRTDLKLYTYSVACDTGTSDGTTLAENGEINVGDFIYNRTSSELFSYDGVSFNLEPDPTVAWKNYRPNMIIDEVVKLLETNLYGYGTEKELVLSSDTYKTEFPVVFNEKSERRFLEFCTAKNITNPYASVYDAQNAFTWNYKTLSVEGNYYATWYMMYFAYFGTVRPDLEPWVLMGYSEKPTWFDSVYLLDTVTQLWESQVWIDIVNGYRTVTIDFITTNEYFPDGPWTKQLCVKTTDGVLLPPYVSLTADGFENAITNTIPTNINSGYIFGDNSPNEYSWRNSLEFNYDNQRIIFEIDPFVFVDKTWGNDIVEIDSYEIDTYYGRKINHNTMLLHGEPVRRDGFDNENVLRHIHVTEFNLLLRDNTYTLTYIGHIYTDPKLSAFLLTDQNAEVLYLAQTNDVNTLISGLTFIIKEPMGLDYDLGDKFTITYGGYPDTSNIIFDKAETYRVNGLNQLFVNMVRYSSKDLLVSEPEAILRDWKPYLGYKTDSLINTDVLGVSTDAFGIHTNDINALIKKNKFVKDVWLNSIRIVLLARGSTVVASNGIQMPSNKGADWVYGLTFLTNKNTNFEYYTFLNGSSEDIMKAGEGKICPEYWSHKIETDALQTVNIPIVVTGIQNVIDILEGHVFRLKERGWLFDSQEVSNFSARDNGLLTWENEINRFIEFQYAGLLQGAGIVLNPFRERVWFQTDKGSVSDFSNKFQLDTSVMPFVYNLYDKHITVSKNLRLYRNDDITQIDSDVYMEGIHLFVDTYEHTLIFNDYVGVGEDKNLIYDPFLGIRIKRLYLETERQVDYDGRLTFGGHYIIGDQSNRNIEGGIQGLNVLYDVDKSTQGSLTTKAARALLGYSKKDYMENLGITDKAQFNFWRGLIHNKGSNLSVDAFLNSARFKSANIDEYWAYRISEYGDSRPVDYPEIKLSADENRQQFLKLQFLEVESIDPIVYEEPESGFIGITPVDDDRWFGIQDLNTELYFEAYLLGTCTYSYDTGIHDIIADGKKVITDYVKVYDATDLETLLLINTDYELLNATTIKFLDNTISEYVVYSYAPAQPKYNPAKLIDHKNKVVLQDLELWDPARGMHVSEAEEIVDITTATDPTKYNYSLRTNNNSNYNPTKPWGKNEVGTVWWDTSLLGYLPYSDRTIYPNTIDRLAYWGSSAQWSSINLYEWTESPVPPSEYDSIAALQNGSVDIIDDVKLSGNVALKELYKRIRTWYQRPVAWKFSDDPNTITPVYELTVSTDLLATDMALTTCAVGKSVIVLTDAKWTEVDFTDLKFSAISSLTTENIIGEAVKNGDPYLLVGSTSSRTTASFVSNAYFHSFEVLVDDKADASQYLFTNETLPFDVNINTVSNNSIISVDYKYIRCTNVNTNKSQSILVTDISTKQNVRIKYEFDELGVSISAVTSLPDASASIDTTDERIAATATYFGNSGHDVVVRAALPVFINMPFVDDTDISIPLTETEFADIIGYKEPPTSNKDARWIPVYGNYIAFADTPKVFELIKKYLKTTKVDPDGTKVIKYKYTWDDFLLLTDDIRMVKYDGSGSFYTDNFTFTDVDTTTRFNVFVNGVITNDWNYNGYITVSNVTLGDTVRVVYRKIIPTDQQLSFDPTVSEEPSQLEQYRYDYQYTKVDIRDQITGDIVTTYWYFWVANKTTVTQNRTISLKNAAKSLKYNPNPFGILQNLKTEDVTRLRYTQFIASGLNKYVTRDNYYKLRFTKNFILRDDPDDINLKNVHAEWVLIREAQRFKLPVELWEKLISSTSGFDIAGNPIPSTNRVYYDNKHGTNTRYGADEGQSFVDSELAKTSILYTIENKLNLTPLEFLGYDDLNHAYINKDSWFATPEASRKTLTDIYNLGTPTQVNSIWFAVFYDALSESYEFSDIFKTSWIAIYSVKLINTVNENSYEVTYANNEHITIAPDASDELVLRKTGVYVAPSDSDQTPHYLLYLADELTPLVYQLSSNNGVIVKLNNIQLKRGIDYNLSGYFYDRLTFVSGSEPTTEDDVIEITYFEDIIKVA